MLSIYFEEEAAHQYKENRKIKDNQGGGNSNDGVVEISIGDEEDDE